jgi:AraC-like DNA-binding protein/mannose-6-phosphate isomerase-like protein (cupin superfamily)
MKIAQFVIPQAKENSVIIQEEAMPYFYNHLHEHSETQITWIIKGEGTLIVGNHIQAFKKGDIYIIGANQPHIFRNNPEYFNKESDLDVQAITVFFSEKGTFNTIFNLPEMKEIKRFMENSVFGLQVPALKTKQIIAELRTMKNVDNGYKIASFLKLLQILSEIKNWKVLSPFSYKNLFPESQGSRMNDVIKYIMENYTENIKLKHVSDIACLTPQAFCRYFKKHTGKTFIVFLNEIRINEASKKVLKSDLITISSIAYDMGFKSAVSFNRAFKQIMGKSPLKFRNEFKNKTD